MSPPTATHQQTDDTVACPHCGSTVPHSPYCGSCGAHLEHSEPGQAARRRLHAYAAFPDEPVLRVGVVSSLLPQLSSRSRAAFRAAFLLVVVVIVALALARLEATVIAVSALAVPVLFTGYVVEVEPLEKRFVVASAEVLLTGGALGVLFAFVLGRSVADALVPGVATSLTSGTALRAAVLAPVVLQLLMAVPVVLLRLQQPSRADALDGFTAGALGALGVSVAMTLVELAAGVRTGNVVHGSVLSVLTQALVRGLSTPLVGAALTGYVGAALWRHHNGASGTHGRWLTSPVWALAVALVIQVGLGFTDVATLFNGVLVVVHLTAALLALVALRIGLHHILLHERREIRIGEPRQCPHCLHEAPGMPFCPTCGVAEGATPLHPVPWRRPRGGALEPRELRLHDGRHLGQLRLLLGITVVLGLVAGLFAVLAAVVPSVGPGPCLSLRCFSPFGPVPVTRGTAYASSQGWGLTWYPASAVFPGAAPQTTARPSSNQLELDFTSSTSPAEDGKLFFVGEPARGQSAAELVTALQQANAPNATLDYTLPNPTIGYHLGYGEALETTPNSFDADGVTYEVVIDCAVLNRYAVCLYGVGPQVNLSQIADHPTPSKLALSLWSDPDANSVYWKGAGDG